MGGSIGKRQHHRSTVASYRYSTIRLRLIVVHIYPTIVLNWTLPLRCKCICNIRDSPSALFYCNALYQECMLDLLTLDCVHCLEKCNLLYTCWTRASIHFSSLPFIASSGLGSHHTTPTVAVYPWVLWSVTTVQTTGSSLRPLSTTRETRGNLTLALKSLRQEILLAAV